MKVSNPQVTKTQIYQSVLADIGMAMAINTLDPGYAHGVSEADYAPGAIRDGWLNHQEDKLLRLRVKPRRPPERRRCNCFRGEALLHQAKTFGVPLKSELAFEIAEYLSVKKKPRRDIQSLTLDLPGERRRLVNAVAIFLIFLKLGGTSFGGPIVHLGYFRAEFVALQGWLHERAFVDLIALCPFLPGPASSEVGIAPGLLKGGLPGAFLAWFGFTLPSDLTMTLKGLDPGENLIWLNEVSSRFVIFLDGKLDKPGTQTSASVTDALFGMSAS